MRTDRFFTLILVLGLLGGVASAESKQWLHVRVETPKKGGEMVSVNIPLSLAETVLPMIKDKQISGGKIRIEEKDVTIQDLRKIWAAVKAEGDAEYVSVQNAETNLRVAIQGNYLVVRTDEKSKSQVEITLPTTVVDALLSSEDETLDILAAIRALQETGSREIVSIRDEDTNVRVWIDDVNSN